jgi:phosphatidylglycerol:prolipoprotein diacylglycerol transferase
MYLVAFFVVYLLVRYRINKAEYEGLKIPNDKLQIPNKIQISKSKMESLLLDFLLYAFIGLIIGARLGEVFFYNFSYYSANPLMIISPFDPVTHKFIGIYGMSYHGGLIGVAVTAWIWARKNNINLLSWGNLIAPAIPAGYFFGRIGNFINGELYGRPTSTWWGMYFPSDPTGQLRHPSQLYEAFLEGILLFFILWPIRRKYWARNNMLVLYLSGYAVARITSEFFREPDGLIGFLTLGQFYSLLTLLAAFLVFLNTRKSDIIKERKEIKNNSEEF